MHRILESLPDAKQSAQAVAMSYILSQFTEPGVRQLFNLKNI